MTIIGMEQIMHTHNPEDEHVIQNGQVGHKQLFCTKCATPLLIVPVKLMATKLNLR